MALKANALISLDDMRTFLSIPAGETNMNSLLETLIDSSSELIEKYCNRHFIQQTYTEYYNGGSIYEILTNHWPIISITSIHVSNSRVFDATSLLDSSNYEAYENEQGEKIVIERFDGLFPRGRRNVKIIYVAGYVDMASLPSSLQLGCKITTAFYYLKQQQKDWNFSVKSKGDENITLIQGIPKSAIELIEPFKRLEMIAPADPVRNI